MLFADLEIFFELFTGNLNRNSKQIPALFVRKARGFSFLKFEQN